MVAVVVVVAVAADLSVSFHCCVSFPAVRRTSPDLPTVLSPYAFSPQVLSLLYFCSCDFFRA